jgi:nucleoside-diphosphate-sugar epimerase
MREFASDPLKEFRTVNTAGSEQLALEAADAGVRRLVFMSTIGVNGDNSGEKPFSETDDPSPHNPYSVSKYEAELSLQRIARQTGLEIVIVRAPLVYGPGNPGNFHSLLRGVTSGIPLPFASVVNSRSLVYVGNLVDALTLCAFHSRAAGNRYLLSDGEDMSTPELIRRTASALGIKSHLFPFPPKLMMAAGAALGKTATVNSLIASLAVDSSKIRRELGWHPPFSVDQGLKNTANWFLEQR